MPSQPAGRSGAVLIRAWVESGSGAIRARLCVLKGLDSSQQLVYAAAGREEIIQRVRSWLDGLITEVGDPPGSPTRPGPDGRGAGESGRGAGNARNPRRRR